MFIWCKYIVLKIVLLYYFKEVVYVSKISRELARVRIVTIYLGIRSMLPYVYQKIKNKNYTHNAILRFRAYKSYFSIK